MASPPVATVTTATTARPTLSSLWIQLQNNRVEALDGRGFVPPVSLSTIFTPSAIAGAVAELSCAIEDRLGLADAIRQGGIATFAVLVCMWQPDLVVVFRRKRCLERLPLDEETVRQVAGEYAKTFERLQWEFVPYHFRRGQDVEIGREVLPFVRDLGPLQPGGFGDIHKLEIHPSLQDFAPVDSNRVVVVRKILRQEHDVSDEARLALYSNEKRCLRLVNHPPHPNIVPLLTAYTHGRDYCMIFPLFDMDLKKFLLREEPHSRFRYHFTYFSAMHGLASALERVHDVRVRSDGAEFDGIGYHHDLRTANVLVGRGSFFLNDFGMGFVREPEAGSTTRFKALAGDYVAPECMDEEFTPLDVGRAIDIWAFGCLMSEVMSYRYLGVNGVKQYRAARKVTRPTGYVTDSLFHDGTGQVKAQVKEWIDFLAGKERQPALGVPLRDLVLSILTPVDTRPKISLVCLTLANLSLKAHFFAVLEALLELFDGDSIPSRGSLMKLWFERERLRAFGSVLGLLSVTVDVTATEFVRRHGDKCVKTLLELFYKLARHVEPIVGDEINTFQPLDEQQRGRFHESSSSRPQRLEDTTIDGSFGNIGPSRPFVTANDGGERESLESDCQRLIGELWGLLPSEDTRKAERIWVHSMLDATESVEQLDSIERTLGAQRPIAYQQGAALATMKKIRLQILHGHSNQELAGLEIREEIPKPDTKHIHGHQMGVYKGNTRVLIESVHYDSSWEKIPPHERALVMALKSTGFNPKPRPPSLRILDCIGFFETKAYGGGQTGFSFVYRVPEPTKGLEPTLEPTQRGVTTLNRLLVLSAKQSRTDQHTSQPLLDDRFWLASTLASFLAEFHNTGWLHENFHSNNIVFFDPPAGMEDQGIRQATSEVLREPFVVGLDKSRPGGEAWHTLGPAEETDFLDYRHPAYQRTGRFRVGYDYYSLGVMLLEIGLWTPLAAIAGRREHRALSPDELRDTLVSRYVPRLGHKMGKTYRKAVSMLLSDQLDLDPERTAVEEEIESNAFSLFLEAVVDPLERLAGSI